MTSESTVPAAGGIVWRARLGVPGTPNPGRNPGLEIALIHRPEYRDWTFPKGKADPGETLQATAVREIAEETGLRVRLGHPIGAHTYTVSETPKQVSYWCARLTGEQPRFVPNKEVDVLRWVTPREAAELLSYERDVAILERFAQLRSVKAHRARTLIVLRHGKAAKRATWTDDDLIRPLAPFGREQATALVPLLDAYGVQRVVSSPALRCTKTVEPYADSIATFLQIDERVAEGTRAAEIERSVTTLLDHKRPVVLCSHSPTIPTILSTLGVEPVDLSPGQGVVVHHRKSMTLATELIG